MNLRTVPPFALPALMLGVPLLGSLASVARGVLLGNEDGTNLLTAAAMLVLPVVVMTALCIWVAGRRQNAAWAAGLIVALVATVLNFSLLMPEHSPEISTPLTLYIMFGWLFPLLPAALLGGVVGAAVWPEPKQVRRPKLPVKPWLWPIVLPLLSLTVAALRMEWSESKEFVPLLVLIRLLTALTLLLGFMLLPLALLRVKAKKTHQVQPHLSAWWGVCVGLALAVLVFEVWLANSFGLLFVLNLVLPFVGYGLGLLWGERRGKIAAPPAPTHPNG